MAISFVSAVSTNTAASTGSFTLTKPASVADGDLLVALVGVYPGSAGATVTGTAPSGWTKIAEQYSTARPSFPMQIAVYVRYPAAAADPATWGGTFSRNTGEPGFTVVSAYRGTTGYLSGAVGTSQMGSGSSLATATVNNTLANSWRIVCGGYTAADVSSNLTSNEVSRRDIDGVASGGDAVQGAIFDSNAAVATGNTSRTISRSAAWDAACSAIFFIKEASTTPSTGDMACTVPAIDDTFAVGEVHDDGTVSASVPLVTTDLAGEGQPQPSSGGFTAQLPLTTVSVVGGIDPRGSFECSLPLLVDFVGETVPFGIRVIAVDSESRTITVPSRGVED